LVDQIPIRKTEDIHKLESFRRGLVFGTGLSLLLISVVSAKNMWEYLIFDTTTDIYDIALLIFSSSGITYVVFLWFSFLLIGIKNLRGCAWTGIEHGLLNCDIHICVDSVLNGYQDKVQGESGISVELLKTDGSRLWIIGLIGLLVFAYVLIIVPSPFVKLIFIGSFSSLYYLYGIVIHRFSRCQYLRKGNYLTGVGDYPRVISELLGGLRKGSSSKKS
jgi:hypothetical protein